MDWEEIKTFREVMAAGTVRAAAKSLKVHHSTVSRRIDQLEQSLGVALFERRPEGYFPTQAGEELAEAAGRFNDDLVSVERHIVGRDNELSGSIKVTMAEPFAINIFAPYLPEFCEQYPGLELEIITSYDLLDVARREADIAIRMDNNPPDTLVGKRLFSYTTSVYAHPDYIAAHDFENHPEEARWLGWEDREGRYPDWTQNTEFKRVPVWGSFSSISLQLEMAQRKMGLIAVPCLAGDGYGDLVRATNQPPTPSRDIWILTHQDLRKTARVRVFMEFAERILRAHKPFLLGELQRDALRLDC